MNNCEKLLSIKEASKYLRVSPSTIRRMKMEGTIKYIQYRNKGAIYFYEAHLKSFIEASVKQVKLDNF